MGYHYIRTCQLSELKKEAGVVLKQWLEVQAPGTSVTLMPVQSIEGELYAFPGGKMLLLDAFETGAGADIINSYPVIVSGCSWFVRLPERNMTGMAMLRLNAHIRRRNGKTSTDWGVWVTPPKYNRTVSPAQF